MLSCEIHGTFLTKRPMCAGILGHPIVYRTADELLIEFVSAAAFCHNVTVEELVFFEL